MIATIILIVAGICNAVMDKLVFHHGKSIFKNSDPTSFWGKESWRRKWKDGDKSKGEAFPLSSTVFVFLTDGWHLMKFIQLTCFFYLISPSVWLIPACHLIYGGAFEVFFKWILNKK